MAIRINDLNHLASLTIDTDASLVVVSMPTGYLVDEDPSLGYDADTEALWAAVREALEGKGWMWDGGACFEDDGNGEYYTFTRA